MNKIISITLQEIVLQIEEDANVELETYLSKLKNHLAQAKNREQLINDIESRIADLLFQKLMSNKTAFALKNEDVINTINSLGPIEALQFEKEDEELETPEPKFVEVEEVEILEPQKHIKPKKITRVKKEIDQPKKLFRDPQKGILGGVCSGLATYFGISKALVRLILFMLIFFGGISIWVYIVLWMIIPPARTSADRLEMEGKKITLVAIVEEVDEKEKEVKQNLRKDDNIFKKIINFTGKIIGFLIGSLIVLLLVQYLVDKVLPTNSIPWKLGPNYFESSFLNSVYAILFFLAFFLPFVWIFARLFRKPRARGKVRGIGRLWVFIILALLSIYFFAPKRIKAHSKEKSTIGLPANDLDLIVITKNKKNAIPINIDIEPSLDNSASLEIIKTYYGKDNDDANEKALLVSPDYKIKNNQIVINTESIPINKSNANLIIDYIIYLPKNRKIVIDNESTNYLKDLEINSIDDYNKLKNRTIINQNSALLCADCEYDNTLQDDALPINYRFHEINLNGRFDIEIKQGSTYDIEVKDNSNLNTHISKDGEILTLSNKNFKASTIEIRTPRLKTLSAQGSGDLSITGFDGDLFDITLKGKYNTKLKGIDVKILTINLDGKTDLKMLGNAQKLYLQTNGIHDIDAEKMRAKDIDIQYRGQSGSKLWALNKISGLAKGTHSIGYKDKPIFDLKREGTIKLDAL